MCIVTGEEFKNLDKREMLKLMGKKWKGVRESGESSKYDALACESTTVDEPKEKKLKRLKKTLIKVVGFLVLIFVFTTCQRFPVSAKIMHYRKMG